MHVHTLEKVGLELIMLLFWILSIRFGVMSPWFTKQKTKTTKIIIATVLHYTCICIAYHYSRFNYVAKFNMIARPVRLFDQREIN